MGTTMRALISEQEETSKNKKDKAEHIENVIKQSKICSIRTRLCDDFILFEQFNMNLQIKRVLFAETNNERMSGAVYYLLKTLAVRAFNTYYCNVSCACVNNLCNGLESVYKAWLDTQLRCQTGQRQKTNIAEKFLQTTKHLYGNQNESAIDDKQSIFLLNVIDESIADNALCKQQLEQEVEQIFASEKEKFKIFQTLNGFDDISNSFERISDRGIQRFAARFEHILASSLYKFKEADFAISSKQFEANTVSKPKDVNTMRSSNANGESFVDALIGASKASLYALSKRLTASNFDRFLLCFLSFYLCEIERFAMNQTFSFWGAMKFDQHRQELQSFFSEQCHSKAQAIRNSFARIRSIAEILQFSKIDEASHYLEDDERALNANQMKKILKLRTEFSDFDVDNLKIKN